MTMDLSLKSSLDYFLGGKIKIEQAEKGYRAGLDAILLAASFKNMKKRSFILDAGCGVGTVMLSAACLSENAYFVGVDKDQQALKYAQENIDRNAFKDRATCFQANFADIDCVRHIMLVKKDFFNKHMDRIKRREPYECFEKTGSFERSELFDQVLVNPPYFKDQSITQARNSKKEKAFVCDFAKIEDWIQVCLELLKPKGQLTMIYRADGLGALIKAFGKQCGDIHVKPIYAYPAGIAKRILIGARKGIMGTTTVLSPLILHDQNHLGYTDEANAILRGESSISLWE